MGQTSSFTECSQTEGNLKDPINFPASPMLFSSSQSTTSHTKTLARSEYKNQNISSDVFCDTSLPASAIWITMTKQFHILLSSIYSKYPYQLYTLYVCASMTVIPNFCKYV
jgi:hypothetical protein